MTTEQHIDMEFELHRYIPMMNESHGYIDGLESALKIIEGEILNALVDDDGMTRSLKGKSFVFSNVLGFDTVTIVADIDTNKGNTTLRTAQYRPDLSSADGKDIFIKITLCGSLMYVSENIKAVLSHELMHAHEDKGRKEHGAEPLKSIATGLYAISTWVLRGGFRVVPYFVTDFARCCYYFHGHEVNANMEMLYSELLTHKNEIKDAKSAIEVLRKTKTFNDFETIKRLSEKLKPNMSETIAGILASRTNQDITKEDIEAAIKMIQHNAAKFDRKIKSQASKMLYDIYEGTYDKETITDIFDLV